MSQPPAQPTHSVVTTLNPPDIRDVSSIYSHVAITTGPSRLIITAGQVGASPDGSVSPSAEEQARLAFANLKKCLEAAGAGVKDIMKLTYYSVNYDYEKRPHTKPLLEFLDGHRPAITSIPVVGLARPEYLFEVEATAAVPL